MERTAMQELIKTLQDNRNALQGNTGVSAGLANAIAVAKSLLSKEREQIVEAAAYGNGRASVEDKNSFGEQYYSSKYGEK